MSTKKLLTYEGLEEYNIKWHERLQEMMISDEEMIDILEEAFPPLLEIESISGKIHWTSTTFDSFTESNIELQNNEEYINTLILGNEHSSAAHHLSLTIVLKNNEGRIDVEFSEYRNKVSVSLDGIPFVRDTQNGKLAVLNKGSINCNIDLNENTYEYNICLKWISKRLQNLDTYNLHYDANMYHSDSYNYSSCTIYNNTNAPIYNLSVTSTITNETVIIPFIVSNNEIYINNNFPNYTESNHVTYYNFLNYQYNQGSYFEYNSNCYYDRCNLSIEGSEFTDQIDIYLMEPLLEIVSINVSPPSNNATYQRNENIQFEITFKNLGYSAPDYFDLSLQNDGDICESYDDDTNGIPEFIHGQNYTLTIPLNISSLYIPSEDNYVNIDIVCYYNDSDALTETYRLNNIETE